MESREEKALAGVGTTGHSEIHIQAELVNPIYAAGYPRITRNPKPSGWGASPHRSAKNMKTIMQVHILVRVFGIGLIILGLYRIAKAIPALKELKEIQEKQKELMGQEFYLTELFPTFTEMVFEPVVFVVIGFSLYFFVKKIVRLIIGSEQIEALLKLDRAGGQNKSR